MLEKRWERRLLCADMVEVEWQNQAGAKSKATAILEDISRAGACVQTDVLLPVDAVIRIHHGRKTLEGKVTYCEFREIGYFVGMTFTADQHWSERLFRPKHLLDPVELELEPD